MKMMNGTVTKAEKMDRIIKLFKESSLKIGFADSDMKVYTITVDSAVGE